MHYIRSMAERATYFVNVILPLSIPTTYTYRVPFELNEAVGVGKRVVVLFGRSKYYTALVREVHQTVPRHYQAKYIETVLDASPIVTAQQFRLWDWIATYYLADIGEVMNAALPANFKLASETKLSLHPAFDRSTTAALSDHAHLILDALQVQDEVTLKEVAEITGIKTVQPLVKQLIDKRYLIVSEALQAKYRPKWETYVQLAEQLQTAQQLQEQINALDASSRNARQLETLLKLVALTKWKEGVQQAVAKSVALREGCSASAIRSLEKKQLVTVFKAAQSRLPQAGKAPSAAKPLSDQQQKARASITAQFREKQVVLLHGVTGSGKTEIYVQLIQEAIQQQQQVLFLLPEIALTTQLIHRLQNYFGDLVGVYHSRFNQNERVEIWNKVLENDPHQFRIVLGARSAVFLPFQNLGLVIVDEEHENSFKQYDPSPRYNGRDVAIVLAQLHGAKVLLGSATPSVESYYNAEEGRYGKVELTERYGGVQLPEIQCADLKKERKQKTMKSHFSSFLLDAIETTLGQGQQVILFQNRRGYAPIWMCEMCGWTPQCHQCDVSLTYHKSSNMLRCHYCGYHTSPPSSCSACGSRKLKMLGFGTEKIEDELAIYFPDARLKRMDLDTTRAKNAHASIISAFEDRLIDVLIGTQMVTKGLDFDNVGLVGVLSADQLLNFPDFRSFERAYQLMSQVAGRAGRVKQRGRVVIQTFEPHHWVIQKVIAHDYSGFYQQEVVERSNFNYPPFFRMIHLKLRHKDNDTLEMGAAAMAQLLRAVFNDRVLGPEAPPVRRIRNYYIKHITIKFERTASPQKVKTVIREKIDVFLSQHDFRSILVDINVDPQ